MNWLAYQLLRYGPDRLVLNADTRFGRWCLQGAGRWAHRDHPDRETP